ncbi:ATP-binding cassette domain-containing protein, partial [Actinomycetes bacterium M1A6_2h]
MSSSVVISDLSFTFPDGRHVFDGVNAVFDTGRIGLVAHNGTGKSTLLKLIAGELHPDSGSVTVGGSVGYLPQDLTASPSDTVASVLGIANIRIALGRIESGSASDPDFDLVEGSWDIDERAIALLGRLGLHRIATEAAQLDRTVGSLSGGELTLLSLAARLLGEPSVLLLDEPTNNLDTRARGVLEAALAAFSGTAIVVS